MKYAVYFFDFEKAFDAVSHRRLMEKLVVTWLYSYRTKRQQSVVVNGVSSLSTPVISGAKLQVWISIHMTSKIKLKFLCGLRAIALQLSPA